MGSRRNGFTLIELIIVLAIVATLLSLVAPRYFTSVNRSKEAVLKQNLNTIREAIDKFYGDTGRYPNSLDDLVMKRYLRGLPVDPVTERSDGWMIQPPPVDAVDKGQVYDVHSGAPGKASDGSEYKDW